MVSLFFFFFCSFFFRFGAWQDHGSTYVIYIDRGRKGGGGGMYAEQWYRLESLAGHDRDHFHFAEESDFGRHEARRQWERHLGGTMGGIGVAISGELN